jgi:predicted signal transduction protein with EAL and GGDEF domain
MAEGKQSYRKKQAYLVILVFACIGIAIWAHSAPVAVVAILAACGIAFYASTLEPEKAPEEHHHH